MKKKNRFSRILIRSFALTSILFLILLITSETGSSSEEKVLFMSNFSDLHTNWEIWDDPEAEDKPSQWRVGLAELSGIYNSEQKMATALLAGKTSWQNYSVETSCYVRSGMGHLLGIVFGLQDPEHCYIAGYNFDERQFELVAKTPEGFEDLSVRKIDFPDHQEIPLRLEFAGSRIRFLANDRLVFDIEDGRYQQGRFGLCASEFRDARVHLGSVTVKSLDPAALPQRQLQDLLSMRSGAKVVSASESDAFEDIIDHEDFIADQERDLGSSLSLKFDRYPLPMEAVFSFPQEKMVEIQRIMIQLSGSDFPGRIEFLVSETSPDEGFRSLGTFQIKPEKETCQEFKMDKVKAKYLKFRVLSSSSEERVRISEILVNGYFKGSERSSSGEPSRPAESGQILFTEDFSSGTLDKWQIWDDPQASNKPSKWTVFLSEFSGISNELNQTATALLAGEKSWKNYSVQTNMYASEGDGSLTGLIFGYQDAHHYYAAGYNHDRDRFELRARTPQGSEMLAYAEVDYPRHMWLSLQADFTENRIIFTFNGRIIFDLEEHRYTEGRIGIGTSALGGGHIFFDKIKITPCDPGKIPSRQLQDLLSSRRGAAVIYRTEPPKSDQFDEMLDHYLMNEENMGNGYDLDLKEAELPEEAVFCFPQGRFVEIHRIGFKLSSENFPKEINFWTSIQTPKSGFKHLETITLQPDKESYQEFTVKPTRAKYLKVQITKGYDPEELDIEEMFIKGYFQELGLEQSGQETLGKVELQEEEPNDSLPQAQSLPPTTYLGGKAEKGDIDFYRLSLKDPPGNRLFLYMNNIGILRPDYKLLTETNEIVEPSRVVTVKNTMEILYDLDPGDYYLRLERPQSYLTIMYDDSGSMGPSADIVKRVLKGYLENLGEGLHISLMKYKDEVFTLSDFTDQPALLKEAIEKEVRGGGGTDTFLGLMEAIKSVKEKQGNRAVLAVFDEIDGEQSDYLRQYIELWDAALDSGISFSTIGVQSGWHDRTGYFGNSRHQIFSEIAFSSGGQFYHSPSDEQVEQSANILFNQLTSPVEYRLKAEWKKKEKRPGFIEILFEKGAEKKAAKNVEIILDASNSMWGQIQGEAKIAIAKRVLEQIITGLPDEMNVGLRLYGHRYGLNDRRACQDTELKVPIGRINKAHLVDIINTVQPKGKTPLVYSVLQAGNDFQDMKSASIILITDGIESCDGDINAIAPALKELGIELRVHIVGFDIKEAEARKELKSIANSTEGTYLDAEDSQELFSSLQQTLQIEYEILDQQGQLVAEGFVSSEAVEIMEGTYTLRLLVEPEPFEIPIAVEPGKKSTLFLTKKGDEWIIRK